MRNSGIAIFWLFIAESISIGVLGGFMGIIIGIIGGKLLNLVLRTLATNAGAEPVSIFYAPTNLIIAMFIGSFIVGFITGFYPAIRAIRTSPLNALRYE